jgi:hypothetical protein
VTRGRELIDIQRLQQQIENTKKQAKEAADAVTRGWEPVVYNLQIAAHMLAAYAKVIQTCKQGIEQLEKDLKS